MVEESCLYIPLKCFQLVAIPVSVNQGNQVATTRQVALIFWTPELSEFFVRVKRLSFIIERLDCLNFCVHLDHSTIVAFIYSSIDPEIRARDRHNHGLESVRADERLLPSLIFWTHRNVEQVDTSIMTSNDVDEVTSNAASAAFEPLKIQRGSLLPLC